MGVLLGIGLKLAAQKLLSAAFTRGGKEKPEQDLDSYRELDQRFETKELPKEPPNIALAPKEQFKESIGDRGYGLSEENKSLYDRLTEDMKSVIDSNYEIAENINKKLDYTNEVAKTANANALNAAQVSATYGKMNQEAIIGLSQKSGSKVGGLIKGLWDGIKKGFKTVVSLAIGGVKYIGEAGKEASKEWTGDPNDDPELAAAAKEAEEWDRAMAEEVERAKKAAREKKAELASRTPKNYHGYTVNPSEAPTGYTGAMDNAFNTFFNSSWYDPSLSGSDAYDMFIKYMGRNNKGFKYSFGPGSENLTDSEKSALWDYLLENQGLREDIKSEESTAKNAEKAKEESEDTVATYHGTQGMTSFIAKGILEELKSIEESKVAFNNWQFSDRLPENATEDDINRVRQELLDEYNNKRKSFADKIRGGKVLTEEQLVELGLKDSEGNWKNRNFFNGGGNYGTNDDALIEQLGVVIGNTYHSSTGNYVNDFSFREGNNFLETSVAASRGILGGDITVKYNGEVVDPTKSNNGVEQLDSNPFNGNGKGYTFVNSLTGETISGTGSGGKVTYEDVANEYGNINEFKSSLSELGYSVEDIGSLTQKQYLELAEKMDLNNETIQYLLTQIWLNTRNNSGITVINASDSEGLSPGD